MSVGPPWIICVPRVVGTRLHKARELRGISQLQLANRLDNSRHMISMVEHGRSELSLGSLSAAAHECRVIRVLGDSMEPTLADGCSILVNRAGRDGVDDWRLVSDNPDKQAWPTLHWPDDAPVIGEVRWVGRTFS